MTTGSLGKGSSMTETTLSLIKRGKSRETERVLMVAEGHAIMSSSKTGSVSIELYAGNSSYMIRIPYEQAKLNATALRRWGIRES